MVSAAISHGMFGGRLVMEGLALALSHRQLAELCREYLLAGHLIDRAGMPTVLGEHGQEAMEQVAIEEWMAASPIYTRRIQELLGFGPGADGDGDVATIFKGMQLDIGAPPEFMDFRYTVHDEHHGEFWLASCGALLDVEPMGESMVTGMCHHIEDPTFDATAAASHPHAQVRPIHRPPRRDEQKAARDQAESVGDAHVIDHAHCHWTVTIDPSGDPLTEPEVAKALRTTSRAAQHPVPVVARQDGSEVGSPTIAARCLAGDRAQGSVRGDGEQPGPGSRPGIAAAAVGEPAPALAGGGWRWRWDYRGELDPDLQLGSFASPVLGALSDEVCLQSHLLSQAFAQAVASRFGGDAAERALLAQFTGIAGLTSQRLARWLAAQAAPAEDQSSGARSVTPVQVGASTSVGEEMPSEGRQVIGVADGRPVGARPGDLPATAAVPDEALTALLGHATPIDVVAAVLELHPAFRPEGYADVRVRRSDSANPPSTDDEPGVLRRDDSTMLTVELHPCPAAEEPGTSWIGLLVRDHDRPLEAAVRGADPRAVVRRVEPEGGAVAAWSVTVDPESEPHPPHDEVVLASFSTGANFEFRRPVL